jgi:uncharacterized protein (UPF0335 family)
MMDETKLTTATPLEQLYAKTAHLEAENKRLRGTLAEIAREVPEGISTGYCFRILRRIGAKARAALAEGAGEEA